MLKTYCQAQALKSAFSQGKKSEAGLPQPRSNLIRVLTLLAFQLFNGF
jgi:hypothetical protein